MKTLILILILMSLTACNNSDKHEQGQPSKEVTSENTQPPLENTNPPVNNEKPTPPIGPTPTPTPTVVEVPPTPIVSTETFMPIKVHYPQSNYVFYKGVLLEEIRPVIESGTIEKFTIDENLKLPEGLKINPTTGVISGIPSITNNKEETFVILVNNKDGKEKIKIELTYSIKSLRALDMSLSKNHLCMTTQERESYRNLGIVCWGDLSFMNDPITEPHFIYQSQNNLNRFELNADQLCTLTDTDTKCKKHNETAFESKMPIHGEDFNEIAMGDKHTCVLEQSKYIKCWGENNLGQLGQAYSLLPYSSAPINLPIPSVELSDLSAGFNHSCFLNKDDKVYCWGDNSYGQIGAGAKLGPVLIAKIPQGNILTVASKGNYNCIIDYNDKVSCWGEMYYNGVKKIHSTPITIQGVASTVFSLALGLEESCAHDNDNLYCWGKNIQGVVKRSIGSVDGHVQIGDEFICVKQYLGIDKIMCWGKNHFGQLGLPKEIKESTKLTLTWPWVNE